MIKAVEFKISGRVQGVFFRQFVKEKADELDVAGFARNESDGSVYVLAEGEEAVLEKFTVLCRRGPRLAHVEQVESRPLKTAGRSSFVIL